VGLQGRSLGWPVCGSRVACGRFQGGLRRRQGGLRSGPKLAYGAQVGASQRPPGWVLAGPQVGLRGCRGRACRAPWMGLRAALWLVLAGRHPGWASGPSSGPLGRRAGLPAPAPRMCRAFPVVSSCGIAGVGKVPAPRPAPGGAELALTTTGRGAAGR
jgi:hypothetical protein